MKLSIVIPAYNEEKTVAELLRRVLSLDLSPFEKEIIVVDDGSNDRTSEILKEFFGRVSVYRHERNQGKGAAVRTGFEHATGDYVVVQDADLEYEPHDLKRMLEIAVEEKLPVIFGSRRLPIPGEKTTRGALRYYLGGVGVTWAANLLYRAHLTDEPTCYKMIRRDVLENIRLTSQGFEFCPEITAKIRQLGIPILEIPIHYTPRSEGEGKKIRAKDGFIALWTLLKLRFSLLTWLVIGLLFLVFLLALPQVFYGLPYHMFGDEEASVYGALTMLKDHTLLPVLHEQDFHILYEPPLLAYTYLVLFTPALVVAYLIEGVSLSTFIDHMTLDPSFLWVIARLEGIFFGLLSIVVTYLLGKQFFKDSLAGLFAALFLGTSFLFVTMMSSAHHWVAGVCASLIAVWFLNRAYESGHKKWNLIYAGMALGCSFGFSYLPFYIFLIAALIGKEAWEKNSWNKRILRALIDGSIVALPFLFIAILFIAVHPYPVFEQIIHHVTAAQKTVDGFVAYYFWVFMHYDIWIFLGSIGGFLLLIFRKKWDLIISLVIFFTGSGVVVYLFLLNIERYLIPFLPVCALLAGYFLAYLFSYKKIFLPVVAIFLIYTIALFGRTEYLILGQDTRTVAKEWIERAIPQNSTIFVNSDRLRLSGTSQSLTLEGQFSPESLRAPDRLILSHPEYAKHPFQYLYLYHVSHTAQQSIVAGGLRLTAPQQYLVEDSWSTSSVQHLFPHTTLTKQFTGSRVSEGLDGLLIGGEGSHSNKFVLSILYEIPALGPDVFIYSLH